MLKAHIFFLAFLARMECLPKGLARRWWSANLKALVSHKVNLNKMLNKQKHFIHWNKAWSIHNEKWYLQEKSALHWFWLIHFVPMLFQFCPENKGNWWNQGKYLTRATSTLKLTKSKLAVCYMTVFKVWMDGFRSLRDWYVIYFLVKGAVSRNSAKLGNYKMPVNGHFTCKIELSN